MLDLAPHCDTFVNLTPHSIVLANVHGEMIVPASGTVARVGTVAKPTRKIAGFEVRVLAIAPAGVTGLPDEDGASVFIVSGMVLDALRAQGCTRPDVVAPATGPQDGAIRNAEGQILGVTRLNGLV